MAKVVKWKTIDGTEAVLEAVGTGAVVKPVEDVVNHPNHYAPNGVDSFMHMKDQMGKDAFDGFLQGNAIKYVQRYQFKGKPVEDLEKAMFYLFHLYLDNGGAQERIMKTADHAWEHFKPEEK